MMPIVTGYDVAGRLVRDVRDVLFRASADVEFDRPEPPREDGGSGALGPTVAHILH